MENRKINYVIGTWSGKRSNIYVKNLNYLQFHLEKLKELKQNLSQISVGFPHNPNIEKEYKKYVCGLKELNGVPIVVYPMENIGISYGQYSRIFNICRDKFTHYIFIEDDYVPVHDNFDVILAEKFDKLFIEQNCGFLCGLILDESGRFGRVIARNAAISNGITNYQVLNTIWEKFNCIPHHGDNQFVQINFSNGFLDCGFNINDYLDEFRARYFSHQNAIRIYGDKDEDIFDPIQLWTNSDWKTEICLESDRPKKMPANPVPLSKPLSSSSPPKPKPPHAKAIHKKFHRTIGKRHR